MSNILEYRGYQGSVDFSTEDGLLFGKVLFINDSLMFHGASVQEITEAFHEVIDDYLLFCKQKGVEPDQPFKGSFNVRIGSELHRVAASLAVRQGVNLNEFVRQAIAEKVGGSSSAALSAKDEDVFLVDFLKAAVGGAYASDAIKTGFGSPKQLIVSKDNPKHTIPFTQRLMTVH